MEATSCTKATTPTETSVGKETSLRTSTSSVTETTSVTEKASVTDTGASMEKEAMAICSALISFKGGATIPQLEQEYQVIKPGKSLEHVGGMGAVLSHLQQQGKAKKLSSGKWAADQVPGAEHMKDIVEQTKAKKSRGKKSGGQSSKQGAVPKNAQSSAPVPAKSAPPYCLHCRKEGHEGNSCPKYPQKKRPVQQTVTVMPIESSASTQSDTTGPSKRNSCNYEHLIPKIAEDIAHEVQRPRTRDSTPPEDPSVPAKPVSLCNLCGNAHGESCPSSYCHLCNTWGHFPAACVQCRSCGASEGHGGAACPLPSRAGSDPTDESLIGDAVKTLMGDSADGRGDDSGALGTAPQIAFGRGRGRRATKSSLPGSSVSYSGGTRTPELPEPAVSDLVDAGYPRQVSLLLPNGPCDITHDGLGLVVLKAVPGKIRHEHKKEPNVKSSSTANNQPLTHDHDLNSGDRSSKADIGTSLERHDKPLVMQYGSNTDIGQQNGVVPRSTVVPSRADISVSHDQQERPAVHKSNKVVSRGQLQDGFVTLKSVGQTAAYVEGRREKNATSSNGSASVEHEGPFVGNEQKDGFVIGKSVGGNSSYPFGMYGQHTTPVDMPGMGWDAKASDSMPSSVIGGSSTNSQGIVEAQAVHLSGLNIGTPNPPPNFDKGPAPLPPSRPRGRRAVARQIRCVPSGSKTTSAGETQGTSSVTRCQFKLLLSRRLVDMEAENGPGLISNRLSLALGRPRDEEWEAEMLEKLDSEIQSPDLVSLFRWHVEGGNKFIARKGLNELLRDLEHLLMTTPERNGVVLGSELRDWWGMIPGDGKEDDLLTALQDSEIQSPDLVSLFRWHVEGENKFIARKELKQLLRDLEHLLMTTPERNGVVLGSELRDWWGMILGDGKEDDLLTALQNHPWNLRLALEMNKLELEPIREEFAVVLGVGGTFPLPAQKLPAQEPVEVLATCVRNGGEFYVRPKESHSDFFDFRIQLNRYMDEFGDKLGALQLDLCGAVHECVGELVAVLSGFVGKAVPGQELVWWRGRLGRKQFDGQVWVTLLDKGTMCLVKAETVRRLPWFFMQLPVQAIRCQYENLVSSDPIGWLEDSSQELRKLIRVPVALDMAAYKWKSTKLPFQLFLHSADWYDDGHGQVLRVRELIRRDWHGTGYSVLEKLQKLGLASGYTSLE